jgi:hypothetical protein
MEHIEQVGILERIGRQLIETLLEIQQESGREAPLLSHESIPLDDLPGFDSVNGVEAEVILSARLGIELKDLAFIDNDDRHLTIGEMTRAIALENARALDNASGTDDRAESLP